MFNNNGQILVMGPSSEAHESSLVGAIMTIHLQQRYGNKRAMSLMQEGRELDAEYQNSFGVQSLFE
jgi:hypothetical protein